MDRTGYGVVWKVQKAGEGHGVTQVKRGKRTEKDGMNGQWNQKTPTG